MPRPLHDPQSSPLPGAATETRNTTCYMCACRCGIRVHLRDGEVRYIDGNPDHPINKGVICAKGSSGIMKQYSPARLTKPLLRKPGAERGAGEFDAISLGRGASRSSRSASRSIRATDPKKFAFFTGRDQMQALTGLFARQFGTPNYAAHGGFCSVNMAAGMIYTIGGSFWEFGGPDLDRAKLFVMIGTAEDHHSNPLKIAISKFKRDGGRFVSINPMRTGYSAIADEWVPIRPGTDGALLLALIHELIALGLYDREFLARYTNAGQLVNLDRERATTSACSCAAPELPPEPDRAPGTIAIRCGGTASSNRPVPSHTDGADPVPATASSRCPTDAGQAGVPAAGGARRATARRSGPPTITGIPAATIRRLAQRDGRHRARPEDRAADPVDRLVGPRARDRHRQSGRVPRDARARRALERLPDDPRARDPDVAARHDRPARAASATRRRSRAMVPPSAKPPNSPNAVQARTRRSAGSRSAGPARPTISSSTTTARRCASTRRSRGSTRSPVHGLMHNVITNAWRGDPYRIDTLHDLHGQHGVELDDEHVGGAPDAERHATRTASTRFRSSSSATRSSRRRPRSPTSCCPTRRISSATT